MYISDVLRNNSPWKNLPPNRYSTLREPSPAPESSRPRANSVKRKEPDQPSFAEIVAIPTVPTPVNDGLVTELSTEIATVKSVCDIVETDIKNFGAEPAVVMIFNGILDAIRGVSNVQAKVVANMQEKSSPPASVSDDCNEFVVVGANSKRARPNRTGSTSSLAPQNQPVSTGNGPAPRIVPEVIVTKNAPISDEQQKLDKFKEAIFDAERSTLVFNLDMGRIPVMNKDTMSKRATLALSTMAAKLDKKTNSVPTAESIEAIDDTLSMVNPLLYGRGVIYPAYF
jgi:hypothetical protein